MTSVILSSALCKDTYPNNYGGEFSNYLNQLMCDYTSAAIIEIYYVPYMWYNVRPTTNYILLKLSGVEIDGGVIASPAELICKIEPSYYVDEYNLIETILYSINKEIYNYFCKIDAVEWKYRPLADGFNCKLATERMKRKRLHRFPAGDDWLQRRGNFMRARPQYFTLIDDGNYHRVTVMKHQPEEVWEVPPDWDVDLMDGQYIGATIIEGKVVFKPRNMYFHFEFAFCKELAYMLGATPFNNQNIVWFHNPQMTQLYKNTNSREKPSMVYDFRHDEWLLARKSNHYSYGKKFRANTKSPYLGAKHVVWHTYIDHDIKMGFTIDIWRNTVTSIWVCSDIIEPTNLGHDFQLPLLRCIPSESSQTTHANHCFIHTQYLKLIKNRIETIKIWFLEESSDVPTYEQPYKINTKKNVKFAPLDINGDVHVRLEFNKNAN